MLFGKMKRVGIDAHMLGDHSGGNETYYKNILEAMVVPNDMEIYLFVKKNNIYYTLLIRYLLF